MALTLSKKTTCNGMLAKQITAKSKYTTFMSIDFLVIIAFIVKILFSMENIKVVCLLFECLEVCCKKLFLCTNHTLVNDVNFKFCITMR